ncbi:hypothetical protein C9374_013346 [Naegleria lovaniensis]|uniref:VIT domain-containing protein n=1 Tax=Naegleria lovaniensis TaxID=51637 RepID=A0AA88H0E8_NAELO|nr:uncharacterized protein C9374_013346 [Naegleria lovaniensis]KAG2391861.1 hypothetical protein C9374_013346 [Naegleria lovaniensis]
MIGKLFGSKKSSKAVDDELSQLEVSSNNTPSTGNTGNTSPPVDDSNMVHNTECIHNNDPQQHTSSSTVAIDSPSIATAALNVPNSIRHLPLDKFISVHLPGEKFSDKASTLLPLVEHHVKCHVTYPLVQVVSTMTFRNANSKTTEGELLLPMPEGATLIGYAMEVNGKLIHAVPVEKEKAKEVFEEEVRSGGKVSMIEKVTQSNCFKTRVYPLPYNTDKTIQVTYQMMLQERVHSHDDHQVSDQGVVKGSAWIPLSYFDFASLRPESKIEFTLNETSLQGYDTEVFMETCHSETDHNSELLWSSKNKESSVNFNARFTLTKKDLKENMLGFNLTVTKQSDSINDILLAVEDGYFMTSIPVPNLTNDMRNKARVGDKVQILWDCSMSQAVHHAKNVKILQAIAENVEMKSVVLSLFSNSIISTKEFKSAKELHSFVMSEEHLIYDGGSNMLLLDKNLISKNVDYCIAFTNGVHTIGHEITPSCSFEKPIYFINTAPVVNASLLKHIATKSGGIYLNANEISEQELLNAVGKPVLSFAVADYEESELEEVYPNEPVSLKEGELFKLLGKFNKKCNKKSVNIAISFRYGSSVFKVQELELPVDVSSSQDAAAIIPLLWAQQKIDSLSAFPHLFKDEIRKIGQDFRIVTDNTSLVVLETLDQYLKHNITPPATLTDVYQQFQQLKQKQEDDEKKREQQKLERVISQWNQRVSWHKTDFKVSKERELTSKKKSLASDSTIERECCRSSALSRNCCRRECAGARCCMSESVDSLISMDDKKESNEEQGSSSVAGSIKIKPWTPDSAYCAAIADSKNPYKEYLKQRESLKDSPAFYLDVADLFLTKLKNNELGVRILSNIAELELENTQLYRIVGYRLDQANELELAEWVFERVKKLSPGEPQSYRDLALVKERMGKYSEAMELFNKVITGKWDMRFDEIELTVATEMNHLLLNDKNLPIIDKRLIHHFDLDIRISMAWDTNDVDIDLHVEEPSPHGEHAYYAHNRTRMGGYVSRDFRQGYGPEEYMLKKAQKGIYKATTNYFASHTQNLTGGTTVLCTFFTNYMRKDEKRMQSTIRLSTNKQDIVVCEIEIA